MANNEYPSSDDAASGIPRLTPEMIKAFQALPHDFEEQYRILQQENPELARLLMIEANKDSPENMERKRAFARGVLTLYHLLKYGDQVSSLETIFELTPHTDEHHTEPPLSA